ncbi:MAG: hypothetical protein EP338_11020 [Bacteroidetes bacterium]|nr:MAG: hypothetical protein EP338_11020 [Bacteroidota bacterium]
MVPRVVSSLFAGIYILLSWSFAQEEAGFVLSSRWFHPRHSQDKVSTVEAIEKFHPKRIDWTYTTDDKVLELYRKRGIPYSLTMNPMVPDSAEYTTQKGRMRTLEQELYVAPWMRKWKIKTPYWGCVNNPDFQSTFLNRGKELLRKGAYGIMVDDPDFNIRLKLDQGIGCFCHHCISDFLRFDSSFSDSEDGIMTLAKKVLKANPEKTETYLLEFRKSYEAFQERAVIDFLANWKQTLLKEFPKAKFLTNNYNGQWKEHHQVFDGGIAELNEHLIEEKKLNELYHTADSLGKTQLFGSNSQQEKYHRILMKYGMEHKRDVLIPWDVYVKGSTNRFYIDYQKFEQLKHER